MPITHFQSVANELSLSPQQVGAVATLMADGCTVPFIARYRKEATGSLDEVALTSIRDRLEQLQELDRRREAILKSLAERDLLTDDLHRRLAAAGTMTELEDIYLPFRPKRRTRASVARERGLEPLARVLITQDPTTDPDATAERFIDPEKELATAADALQGARDIIAEQVAEDAQARSRIRQLFQDRGQITTKLIKGKEDEGAKFRDYFDWQEAVSRAPSHRILAMLRGTKEKVLRLHVAPPTELAQRILEKIFVENASRAAAEVTAAIADGYKRLLGPSLENEITQELKQRADAEAIKVFADNLGELLLASPLGRKRVLALDPGFRTGCKLVVLDRQGQLLHNDNIYPHTGGKAAAAAGSKVRQTVETYDIEAIAVGNGTAGRETESFLRDLQLPTSVPIVMVNESGASIYSASDVARKEFPDHDVTVRGAVSIGRRLQDPLAELVKLDPKSIGVGQYQHDVNQTDLKRSLVDVVSSCVNAVGVEVNTASEQLLTFVSGLGPQLGANIVAHRTENGPFSARKHVLAVPRLGKKAFEQAAGFLRIRDAANPLDGSAVHPESYGVVAAMANDLSCEVADLLRDSELRRRVDIQRYVSDKIGLPTLQDILAELAKPGRDPRDVFEAFQFAEGVQSIEDLEVGMHLPGIVTNVTDFGAFIDIGVHQDGLAHISQLADRYVRHPSEVVKVQQKVTVTVIAIDVQRRRISLSLKEYS